jgi:hypothetical protein
VTAAVETATPYLYGVVAAGTLPAGFVDRVVPIDARHPVRVIPSEHVAAIVSDVSVDEFGEPSLLEHLNDPLWLQAKATAHEDVLEAVLATTDVVPFRFCTIYRSEADVRAYLAAAETELVAMLEQLAGCFELGVKCFVEDDRTPASDDDAEPGASAGRAYLLRRQQEQRAAAERSRAVADCVGTAHERLAAAAVDARLNPPQPPELSGRPEPMILNAAYLVDRADEHFREEVDALAAELERVGLSFEVTGPWPPYNFVTAGPEAE